MTSRFLLRGHRLALIACSVLLLAPFTVEARTLAQIKQLGAISLCANPDALPYSSVKSDPPGFQVELAQAIAEGLGVQLKVDWVVPRRRVREVNCDMLLDSVNDPSLYEGHRLLSTPYQATGVALALGPRADGVNSLRDLTRQQKIGVMIGSVASVVLGKQGVSTSPYAFQLDMLQDIQNGELAGAAVSAPTLSYYMKQHPEARLRMVKLYETEPQLGWSVAVGLRNADEALLSEVNRVVGPLLASGTVARIYEKYGVEHRAP